jgi:hypothetical protein
LKPSQYLTPSLQAAHRHSITEEDTLTYTLEGHCPITKSPWTLKVNKKGYLAWVCGDLIQKALPDLTDDERELILSGISAEGWESFS